MVDSLDDLDPCPDIAALFVYYNELYFDGKLGACSVQWSSSRMTLCAGVCSFVRHGGCTIKLSEPLLKYRPISDLKETLLHEMIHAYLFLSDGLKDREDHGPIFLSVMHKINQSSLPDFQRPPTGYNISVYHSFNDEVNFHRKHHWTCDKCGRVVKRAMNRAPSKSDCRFNNGPTKALDQSCGDPRCLWHMHLTTCGGGFLKTAEPEGYIDRRKPKEVGKALGSVSNSAHEADEGRKRKARKGQDEMIPISNFFKSPSSAKQKTELAENSHERGMIEPSESKRGDKSEENKPKSPNGFPETIDEIREARLKKFGGNMSTVKADIRSHFEIKQEVLKNTGNLDLVEEEDDLTVFDSMEEFMETIHGRPSENKFESNALPVDKNLKPESTQICPVCRTPFPHGTGNREINAHIDSCLIK